MQSILSLFSLCLHSCFHFLISLVLVAVCWNVMKRTAVPVSEIAWPFFFLGAGFMLMESQIVSRMALLFGTIRW